MQTTDERRDPRLLRVPLERVEVELAHEEFDDVFEADGIDVGEGGLALRSAILPDVGARLRCAFASPLDGASIVADGEVVWAHDSGPHLGEFGVRFDDLDEASEASLRRIIEEHEDRALTQAEADELGWPSSPGTLAAPSEDDDYAEEEPETTIALALDGVSTEMIAEIVHAADDAMLVEQALPFLRLGTGLTTEDGRRGSIEGIELRLDQDTPRLVLTVVFDSVREPVPEPVHAPEQEMLEASDVDTVPDAALPFDVEPVIVASVPVPVVEDVPVVTRSRPSAALRAPEPEPVAQKSAREPSVKVKREPTQTFRIAHEDEEDERGAPAQKTPGADALAALRTRVLPALARFFATIAAFMQRTYRVVSPKIAGAVGTARSRASHMVTSLRAQQRRSTSRPRAEAAQAPRRRTQGGRPSVVGPEATAAPITDLDARKRKNRIVLGLAAGTILVGAIGLMSEEPAPEPAPVVAAPAPEPEPVVTAPAEPVVLPTNTPAVAAPAPELVPAAPAGGQIEQPTFPTIGASDETTARSVTPAARSMTYGADSVPNGQTFVLDMTTPVESVEGEETENGFRVRLTHTNSNSRASPIAQQHPRVDRASILNQGENAELRIDFLASGRRPAYRVEARGRQLRVILGR